jgi:ankyrin repeat protein
LAPRGFVPTGRLAKPIASAYGVPMRDKIESASMLVTSKPNGGLRSRSTGVDERSAASAMQSGNFAEAGGLLNAGKAPDTLRTSHGASALLCCVAHNDCLFARRLLEFGAHPDRPVGGSQEKTYIGHVLAYEAPRDNQPMLQLLLKHGADPMMPIVPGGALPLHFAAANALAGPARMLAAKGADPFALDDQGKTAIELAMDLPDFQKALMLLALVAPPATRALMDRLEPFFGPDDQSLFHWLRDAWEEREHP